MQENDATPAPALPRPGGQPGNQNARRHGWTSRLNPAPLAEIIEAAAAALHDHDVTQLRRVARALEWRGERALAAHYRAAARHIAWTRRLADLEPHP